MSQPLVSIVVPVFKVPEHYLRKCIESLINQTLQEIEIILVDDGSPDNCGLVCDEFSNYNDNIIVVHNEKNKGVSDSRNSGIDTSSGKYIMFIDGDDWVEPRTVEMALNWINESQSGLVGWNHYYNYETEVVKRKSVTPNPIVFKNSKIKDLLLDMISPEYDERYNGISLGAIRGVWGKLYILDIIKQNNIRFSSDLKIGEDSCFNIDYIKHITKAVFYNEYLSHYRIYNESENHRFRDDIVLVRTNMLKAYLDRFDVEEKNFKTCYVREVLSCVVNCLKKYICNKENKEILKNKISSLSNLLNSKEVSVIINYEYDKMFFTKKEKILLFLVKKKLVFFLYVIGCFLR